MGLVGVITFLTAFIGSLVLIVLTRKITRLIGLVDHPGERKVHQTPIPLGGGIAIFLGVFLTFLLAILAAYILQQKHPAWAPAVIYQYLDGVFNTIPQLAVILLGATVMFSLGLMDDIKGLNPWIKLLVQVLTALFLVFNDISFIFSPVKIISVIITVLWIIGITNAFNLLDHMDGLCSGVLVVVSTIFLIIAFQTGQYFIAYFLLILIGAGAAFLIFNTNPASIFMGDAGSLFLGYMLAVLTILFTFYQEPYPIYSLATPLLVLAVPVFDTLMVLGIRIKNKKPLFKGDMNHLAHRLIKMGMTVREAVMLIYLLTFCTGLSAVLLYQIKQDTIFIGVLIIACQLLSSFHYLPSLS
ncbi:MAG: MraY family glycosyltransferase [Planctomycetota bacterium]